MVVFMMVWHAGNIVCPNGLVSEWSVAHKWHSSTSVCRLWGHGVHANHHCDCANVEQDEAKPTDDLDDNQSDLARWVPLHVAIVIKLGVSSLALHDVRAQRNQEDHEELDEHRPGSHVHAVLGPTLRCPLQIGQLESTHTCGNKEDCKHRAEGDGALCILHCVRDEVPLPACYLLHCDCNPNHDVDEEELHSEVDHTLHCHGDRRRVLLALGVLDGEDRPDDSRDANVDADHDKPPDDQKARSKGKEYTP